MHLRRTGVDSIERQQLLWVGGTGAAATLLVLALWMVPQLVTGVVAAAAGRHRATGADLRRGVTVALLRYRLFDLEKLLGRTLVYAALTLLVVVIYLGVVGLIAAVFSGSAATPTAVAGAVVVAIVVNPLRVVLQRLVNRLLYGDRDDPYQALSRVAEQLTAAAATAGRAAGGGRGCRPGRCGCRTCHPVAGRRRVAVARGRGSAGAPDDCYDLPLMFRGRVSAGSSWHQGARCAVHARPNGGCSPTCPGRSAAAAHEIQLSTELQQSRERLVLAREEERRVIRRTLHDDIGPTIASIGLRAETVRRLADLPAEADRMSAR